jgi:SAM-dependent methyltransferase
VVCDTPPPFEFVFRPAGFPSSLVRCSGCGLVFQDPQPTDEVLAASYYHDPEFSRALMSEYRETSTARARHNLALLEAADAAQPGWRVLDVGCSSGAFLEAGAQAGMVLTGLEIGTATVDLARARGLDVRAETLGEALSSIGGERFDLVTFWDVLEHTRDPRRELELAARVLKRGGTVAATFPNIEGLYPQATYRILARRAGVWEYPELPLHLFDFAPTTARGLFESAGYAVASLRTHPVPFAFYRATSLSRQQLGSGKRGLALRLAFEALHVVFYPAAKLMGRQNALFLTARRP